MVGRKYRGQKTMQDHHTTFTISLGATFLKPCDTHTPALGTLSLSSTPRKYLSVPHSPLGHLPMKVPLLLTEVF